MRWRSRLTALVAVVVAVAVTALSGCVDGTTSPEASPPSSETSTSSTAPAAPDDEEGTIHEEVDPGTPRTADPVPMDGTARFAENLTVRLVELESIHAEASLPGERSGPSVAITVEIRNDTGAVADLDQIVVDLVDSEGLSASPVTVPSRRPLAGELPSGTSATGSYVFSIPENGRSAVTVKVSYAPSAVTVHFTGDLPSA